jgi:hypothetical protein
MYELFRNKVRHELRSSKKIDCESNQILSRMTSHNADLGHRGMLHIRIGVWRTISESPFLDAAKLLCCHSIAERKLSALCRSCEAPDPSVLAQSARPPRLRGAKQTQGPFRQERLFESVCCLSYCFTIASLSLHAAQLPYGITQIRL